MEFPAFDASWKDVVGTLYHEINEFREQYVIVQQQQQEDFPSSAAVLLEVTASSTAAPQARWPHRSQGKLR